MDKECKHFEFVNSQTGNTIGYLTLAGDLPENEQADELTKKQAELAIGNKMYIELIYWKEQASPSK